LDIFDEKDKQEQLDDFMTGLLLVISLRSGEPVLDQDVTCNTRSSERVGSEGLS